MFSLFRKGQGSAPAAPAQATRAATPRSPENGMTNYNASLAKTHLQIQGGLQYSTKPIYFKQKGSTTTAKTSSSEKTYSCHNFYSGCTRYSSSCCKKSSEQKTKAQKQSWSMRIQPSAGFGFVPSTKSDLVTETSSGQPSYTYNAGNLKQALASSLQKINQGILL